MPTERKMQIVKQLRDVFEKAEGVFFTGYQGLDANTLNSLREKLSEVDAEYQVVKNTLVRVAKPDIELDGPSAALISYNNPLAALKILAEFKKEMKKPTFKLGVFENKIIGPEEMKMLSTLPSKEALITQVVQLINSPLNSFANVLIANQRNLILTLKAIADKKGGV